VERRARELHAETAEDPDDQAAETAAAEAAVAAAARQRVQTMNAANPRFILRQHIAARAIERAEASDFTELRRAAAWASRDHHVTIS